MRVLVQYAKADGGLLGVWEADPAAVLTPVAQEEAGSTGYALTDTDVSHAELLSGYGWQEGALIALPPVTLVAEPPALAADGQSECYVTLEPFVPCTVLIDAQPLVLTEADPIVVLTADAPHTFQVRLMAPAPCRAADLTVEAR